jgi:glycerate-2-kinase
MSSQHTHRIQNFETLAKNEIRRQALEIAEAGLDAINTEKIVRESIRLEDTNLFVKDQKFDLTKYDRIKVVGFGKASCDAAYALEQVLGNKIRTGVVIGIETAQCELIQTYAGSHPRPSSTNVSASKKIVELSQSLTEKDLVIVIISGGGSALLCWPAEECDQGEQLYNKFLGTGGTINELNIVRKHISTLKGGGLAKSLYPATVIGLIFSDVPGNHYDQVASGPTFMDDSTVEDAQKIIQKYNLGEFQLIETPKEKEYFENVHNIVLVSNETALEAMAKKAKEFGLKPKIISSEMYDAPHKAVEALVNASAPGTAVLAGGEPMLQVSGSGGTGGRCSFMGLEAIDKMPVGAAAIFLASDGIDNSLHAGAIVDSDSLARSAKAGLDAKKALENFDSGTFFKTLDDLLMTGSTGANVSDLMVLIRQKPSGSHSLLRNFLQRIFGK